MKTWQKSAARLALIVGLAGPATVCLAAEPSSVGEAFGNTIRSTYPDGRIAELWLAADGSYTAHGRRNDPSSGHWKVKGERLCFRQSRPIPSPFYSYCVPMPASGMGKAWSGTAYTGEAIRIQLVQGHAVGGGG